MTFLFLFSSQKFCAHHTVTDVKIMGKVTFICDIVDNMLGVDTAAHE